ncbi:MAG: hypothetical protein ACI90G_000787 [Urechidicola sp.]|jgi:hypothetical protein
MRTAGLLIRLAPLQNHRGGTTTSFFPLHWAARSRYPVCHCLPQDVPSVRPHQDRFVDADPAKAVGVKVSNLMIVFEFRFSHLV